jgi:pyrroloquinoline quinone biosynthesis protein B
MLVRILGAAAGGGLPQWNCRCANCAAARAGSPDVRPRTQSSVAVSADGRAWFLLNVSPDIRQQILAFPPLGPPPGQQRGTGIVGCILTDAELDHTAGLLLLREGLGYGIYSTPLVRRWLERTLRLDVILPGRPWTDLPLDRSLDLRLPDGTASGLRVRAFEVDRHVPRFINEDVSAAAGSVIGIHVEDSGSGGKLVYVPCLAGVTESLLAAVDGADAILVDGTFWSDDEPIRSGIGPRTASDMGHWPVIGPGGSLNWLALLRIRHRVYVHINNTNPMLNEQSAEASLAREQGIFVAADGDEFSL